MTSAQEITQREFIQGIDDFVALGDPGCYTHKKVAWGEISVEDKKYLVFHALLGANGGGGRATVLFDQKNEQFYFSPRTIWPSAKSGVVEIPWKLYEDYQKFAHDAMFYEPEITSVEQIGFKWSDWTESYVHQEAGFSVYSPIALPRWIGETEQFESLRRLMLPKDCEIYRLQGGYFVQFADGSTRYINHYEMGILNLFDIIPCCITFHDRQGDCLIFRGPLPKEEETEGPVEDYLNLDRHEIVPEEGAEIKVFQETPFIKGSFTLKHPEHEDMTFRYKKNAVPSVFFVVLLPGRSRWDACGD